MKKVLRHSLSRILQLFGSVVAGCIPYTSKFCTKLWPFGIKDDRFTHFAEKGLNFNAKCFRGSDLCTRLMSLGKEQDEFPEEKVCEVGQHTSVQRKCSGKKYCYVTELLQSAELSCVTILCTQLKRPCTRL